MRRLALILGLAALSAGCGGATMSLAETAPVQSALDDPGIPEAWRVWRTMIDGADRRLDIAQFYISNKDVPNKPSADGDRGRLEPIIRAIEAAADRGVAVRLLVEAKFARTYPRTLARLEKRRGIEVRRWRAGRDLGGGILHAKYFIVDGRLAWLGSQNFDWRSLTHVQELGVRLEAPATVTALGRIFALDWRLAGGAPSARTAARLPATVTETVLFRGEPTRIRLLTSPGGGLSHPGGWDLPALAGLLDSARSRVRIQLLSLRLRDRRGRGLGPLEAALRRAVRRGVRVDILLSHWTRSRRKIGDAKLLQRIRGITVKLLEVPRAAAGFIPFARVIHAKYVVVDGRRSWIGTSNWAWGYFHNSRNVGLQVHGRAFAAALDAYFERGWTDKGAAVVDPDADYPRPRIAR